jgi:hypothetical protein
MAIMPLTHRQFRCRSLGEAFNLLALRRAKCVYCILTTTTPFTTQQPRNAAGKSFGGLNFRGSHSPLCLASSPPHLPPSLPISFSARRSNDGTHSFTHLTPLDRPDRDWSPASPSASCSGNVNDELGSLYSLASSLQQCLYHFDRLRVPPFRK